MKRITIVKRVCTAYEKKYYSTDKYKCFTYEKTNMAAAHLWIHGFIVSMKDNQKQFSSHYTKILLESQKKSTKQKSHKPKTTQQKQKPKKAKQKHKTKPKIAHKRYKNKEQKN